MVEIDSLAVLIAAVLNMVIGFLWYSKWLFGKTCMKFSKVGEKYLNSKILILYGFFVSLVIAFFLAFFQIHLGIATVSDGMFIGFCIWLGFVATTQIASVIWSKKPFQLFLIDTGYKLLSLVVMSGIIGA